MKYAIVIIFITLLLGCATQQKLKYQRWYIAFLEKEFITLENDITILSGALKKGELTLEEFDNLIEKKFNFMKLRIKWMKEKYEKQMSGKIKERDFNTGIQLIDKEKE